MEVNCFTLIQLISTIPLDQPTIFFWKGGGCVPGKAYYNNNNNNNNRK